jgi:GNAT superfamily N-acetyltransferase
MTSDRTDLRFTSEYSAVHHLSDGTAVRLRFLRPDDRDVLLAGFNRLSPESRYLRFFTPMPRLPEGVLERLLSTDGWNHVAIGAESATDHTGPPEGLGVARFIRLREAPDVAEAAVAVVDHVQRRGLGTLLLSTLAAAARERGIAKFRTEVLSSNEAVKALLRDLDENAVPMTVDGPIATYELTLPEPSAEGIISGPLFHFLKLAGRGVQVLLRHLDQARRLDHA